MAVLQPMDALAIELAGLKGTLRPSSASLPNHCDIAEQAIGLIVRLANFGNEESVTGSVFLSLRSTLNARETTARTLLATLQRLTDELEHDSQEKAFAETLQGAALLFIEAIREWRWLLGWTMKQCGAILKREDEADAHDAISDVAESVLLTYGINLRPVERGLKSVLLRGITNALYRRYAKSAGVRHVSFSLDDDLRNVQFEDLSLPRPDAVSELELLVTALGLCQMCAHLVLGTIEKLKISQMTAELNRQFGEGKSLGEESWRQRRKKCWSQFIERAEQYWGKPANGL